MKAKLPIEIFAIEDDGYHLKTTIQINGKDARVIIDTGASRSVFDQERILNFTNQDNLEENDRMSSGLGTSTMQSQKVQLDKVQLGDLVIAPYEATILDLSHVNGSYEQLDLEPVDGVLGSDIMNDYSAIIDYGMKELTLY